MFQSFFLFTDTSTSPDGTWYYPDENGVLIHADELSAQEIMLYTLLSETIYSDGVIKPFPKSFESHGEAVQFAKQIGLKKFCIQVLQIICM